MSEATSPGVLSLVMAVEGSDWRMLAERLLAVQADLEQNMARFTKVKAQLTVKRGQWQVGRADREYLHESAYARLLARFESQPVIEQAKGILMVSTPCDADTAFGILRKASQRENVPLREIASRIVRRAPVGKPGDGVRFLRPQMSKSSAG